MKQGAGRLLVGSKLCTAHVDLRRHPHPTLIAKRLSISMNPLQRFHLGTQSDDRGRLIGDVLGQSDAWLERTHDFIQWLFPLAERSGASPGAPTLDAATIEAFHAQPALQRSLRASLDRMLAFYGLAWQSDRIVKAANWPVRKHDWFTHDTHNNLRITRILKSLSLLGLREQAHAFRVALGALRHSEPDCGVGPVAWRYWDDALR